MINRYSSTSICVVVAAAATAAAETRLIDLYSSHFLGPT